MAVKDHDIQEDYIINISGSILNEASGTQSANSGFVPFRFYAFGAFNIKKQGPENAYRTFVGEQRNPDNT